MELITGDVSRISRELKTGLDVTRRYRGGKTLLILAAEHGKPEHLQELLKHHAEVNAADDSGMTSLMYAANEPHVGNVSTLLKRGASVDLLNNRGQTALILAVYKSSKKCVDLLVKHGTDVNIFDTSENTALTIAVFKKDIILIDILLNTKTNDTNIKAAFDIAKRMDFQEIVVKIKTKFPSVELFTSCDARSQSVEKAVYVVSHTSLQRDNNYGTLSLTSSTGRGNVKSQGDILLSAAYRGDYRSVCQMLESGAEVNYQSVNGMTALMLAAKSGHLDCMQSLLKYRANVNATNKDCVTALMFAVCGNFDRCVQLLINNNANVNMYDVNGDTALTLAATKSGIECNALLLEAGAELTHRNSSGCSALDIAHSKQRTILLKTYTCHLSRQTISDSAKPQARPNIALYNKTQDNCLMCLHNTSKNTQAYAKCVWNSIQDFENWIINQLRPASGNLVEFLKGWITLIYKTLLGNSQSSEMFFNVLSQFSQVKCEINEYSCFLTLIKERLIIRVSIAPNCATDRLVRITVSEISQSAPTCEKTLIDVNSYIRVQLCTEKKSEHRRTSLTLAPAITNNNKVEMNVALTSQAGLSKLTTQDATPLAREEISAITLVSAIANNNNVEISAAITSLTDVNKPNSQEATPLMYAALKGNNFSIVTLIKLGANVDVCGRHGCTALMFAVLANQPKTVNLLLQSGASFNIMDTDKITALKIAVFKGHRECTQFLISASKNKINRNMCENWSSEIIVAVRNNHKDCLSNIIEAGFNTEVRDEDGMTPLICAIITLNTDIFDLLISKGTSVNFTAGDGKTPLMAAAWVGDVHMLTKLVRMKADVNSIDCNGYTAMMFSCKEGHLECVKCLVESGADVEKENNFGETALDLAIYNGHTECADVLHLKKQNDIFEIGKNTLFNVSCSALLEATFNGEETRLQKILNEGVSTDEKNKALLVASALGRLQFLKLLIRNGAEVNVCDAYGVTPLMECVMGDHVDCLSELIHHKADLDFQNINGATALMLAAMYGHEKCLKMLIRSKSNLNIQDNDGLSALMHATKQNNLKCVEILLEAKASVWPRDKESNNTVTMYAAERGFADCLKLLLKHNAPRYCHNNKFLSAYQLAQRNNHTECCEILK